MPTTRSHGIRTGTALIKRRRGCRTLGIDARDSMQVIRLVEQGFPFSRLTKLRKTAALSMEEVAGFVAISLRTLARRQKEGRLHPDESDRVWRASLIFDMVVDLFEGDVPAARQWLQSPQKALGGKTPLEFASTGVGAREVEDLIGRLEHGVVA